MPWHIDYETRSRADLKKVGSFRYAFDPSAEILCAAISKDAGEPLVYDATGALWSGETDEALELIGEMSGSRDTIYAHNAMFEIAVTDALWLKTFPAIPAPERTRFRCTAAMARRAAMPSSLAKLGEALKLPQQKDSKGAALIRKFCVPDKKAGGLPFTAPQTNLEKWAQFLDYCKQDVRTECAVAEALKFFELRGDALEAFLLDIKINRRGIAVNIPALIAAQKIIESEMARIEGEFRALTGFSVTQGKVFLPWLVERGYSAGNLQGKTIDAELEDGGEDDPFAEIPADGLPPEARAALKLKRDYGYAAVKKIKSMLSCAGPHDNRVRGCKTYHGATTGRDTASLIQPQNFKRAAITHTHEAYRAIQMGIDPDSIRLCFGEPLDVISSCVRHFIDSGSPVLDCDYAQIEARTVNWIADQRDALEEYRQGVERYVRMASVIFGIPEKVMLADKAKYAFPQRFVGKEAVLGLGFGMSAAKFRDHCKQKGGVDLEVGLEVKTVKAFRATHQNVVSLWYSVERAAKNAILHEGEAFRPTDKRMGKTFDKLGFMVKRIAGMPFLLMKLPSGRLLSYPDVRLEDDRITFFGEYAKNQWGRIDTYGAKLVENAVQGTASDVLVHGVRNAETAGYETIMLVHDEILSAFNPETQNIEDLERHMRNTPKWANGLPVATEGKVIPYYLK